MPTAQKATVIENVQEKYSRAAGVFFTEYRGLKVHDMQALRKELGAKGGELSVVKNTLFRRAAGEDAEQFDNELTNGPTAIAFVYENESEVAKVLFDYTKTNKNFVVKGGFLNGRVMDSAGVEALSKLPSREVLIAQVLGAITAPLSNLVGVVEALYADPIRVIGAVADKVGEGGGPVEATATTPADAPAEDSSNTAAADDAAPTEETPSE